MVDEKVTVISSAVNAYIHTKAKLEVEMGSVLIYEGDSHIIK